MDEDKTVLQYLADWLAQDAGKRDAIYEVTQSNKVIIIKRTNKNKK